MLNIKTEGNIIYTVAHKELTNEDYDALIPALEKLLAAHPKVSWYFEMPDFEGWEPKALWRDVKMDVSHAREFDKIAMVGTKSWEKWLTELMKPFTPAEVKYFELADKEAALQWIKG